MEWPALHRQPLGAHRHLWERLCARVSVSACRCVCMCAQVGEILSGSRRALSGIDILRKVRPFGLIGLMNVKAQGMTPSCPVMLFAP